MEPPKCRHPETGGRGGGGGAITSSSFSPIVVYLIIRTLLIGVCTCFVNLAGDAISTSFLNIGNTRATNCCLDNQLPNSTEL